MEDEAREILKCQYKEHYPKLTEEQLEIWVNSTPAAIAAICEALSKKK